MKTFRFLIAAVGAFLLMALPAQADDLPGSLLDPSANSARLNTRGTSMSPVKVQLASGLQTSGPLNGTGPAPIAARLSDDEWRKVFPRKGPGQ